MKTKSRSIRQPDKALRRPWPRRCAIGAMLLTCGAQAQAGDTNSPAMTPGQIFEGGTNAYNNWIDFSLGGLRVHGDTAAAQQRYQVTDGAFGGISDFHYQQDIAKGTSFSLDGYSLFDQNDYKVIFGLQRDDLGYVRVNVNNFRTWYNGAGGYYPATGTQYRLANDDLSLDRGEVSVEAGLTLKDRPKVVFNYSHSYRDGDKSSTIWGPVHPGGSTDVRGVDPSIYNTSEKVDGFALDVTHHIKATDFGGGVRYETASLSEAREIVFWQGEPVQRQVTDRQGTSYDSLTAHAFTETWIKKNVFFSTGFSFANLNDTFSGNRTYGDDFDVAYSPNPLDGLGYFSLNGGAHEQEYVANMNLMISPTPHLKIVPSVRIQQDDWDANSSGIGTLGADTGPFKSSSDGETLDVRERLEASYTGVTNWVYYGGGEWTEGDGNLNQAGGLSQVNGIGVPPVRSHTDDTRWFQKYFVGARWYPYRRTSIDLGGYYKNNQYNYNNPLDSTFNGASSPDRYPAYLTRQSFQTYDGNIRLTLRPVQNVTLVSRYEYQWSTINTTPDAISGLGDSQSSKMTSQIIGQNLSWSPWTRLCLQAGFDYVLSGTKTPASDFAQAVLKAQNNYWTLTFNSCLVLDDKTDLNLTYLYYRADNFNNDSSFGLPLGAGAEEQSVTATITRRISQHLRINLKYAYSHFNDWASGGNNNYDAQLVSTSLQYRF